MRSPRELNGSGRSRRLRWPRGRSRKVLHPAALCVRLRAVSACVLGVFGSSGMSPAIFANAGDERPELQQGVRVLLKDMRTGDWNPGVIRQRRTELCAAWAKARHPCAPARARTLELADTHPLSRSQCSAWPHGTMATARPSLVITSADGFEFLSWSDGTSATTPHLRGAKTVFVPVRVRPTSSPGTDVRPG